MRSKNAFMFLLLLTVINFGFTAINMIGVSSLKSELANGDLYWDVRYTIQTIDNLGLVEERCKEISRKYYNNVPIKVKYSSKGPNHFCEIAGKEYNFYDHERLAKEALKEKLLKKHEDGND